MIKHTIKAFFFSVDGVKAAFKDEVAFRLIFFQTIIVLALIIILPLTYIEIALLIISSTLCLIVELLNSAIENVVDLVTNDWHILAKKAKDMASAAQFLSCILLYIQLALILYNYFLY